MKQIIDFIKLIANEHPGQVLVLKGFPQYDTDIYQSLLQLNIDEFNEQIDFNKIINNCNQLSSEVNTALIHFHELLILKEKGLIGLLEPIRNKKKFVLVDIDLLEDRYLSLQNNFDWKNIIINFEKETTNVYHTVFSYLQNHLDNYVFNYVDFDFEFSIIRYFSEYFNQVEVVINNYVNKDFICELNSNSDKDTIATTINSIIKSSQTNKVVLLINHDKHTNAFFNSSLKMLSFFGFEFNSKNIQVQSVGEFDDDYLSILKRKNYTSFRTLTIYKDPDTLGEETKEISQKEIINDIFLNVIKASKGDFYNDVFLTSPTGAGKSVIFQIPAVLAAEKFNLVTIVVSPLIGLMNNQVLNIKQMTECAETINSDITPIDKEKIKENLVTKNHDGSYKTSILYISPETLLSNRDIKVLIGDRKIGLVVIDEAHIVSTWGKSFRPDYWFLGEYLKQLRKDQAFPIAAFTATAVYGGKDDMYYDIIESLFLNVSTLYLGSVKRNNILFEIENFKKVNDYDVEKAKKVVDEAIYSIKNDKKTLIYFPFKNTLERTKRQTEQELTEKKHILKTAIYMGGNSLNAIAKQQAVEDFISGKVTTMFATKAFGMGIDIEDIERVYHFAPTGNLSDYVQEIGRVARKESIQGVAKTDFYEEDFRYIKQLFGLSSIKQFEVSEVARKILDIYSKEKKRNFLVSPEAFSYIFGSVDYDEVETRLKSILLVIKKDLETTNGLFPFSLVFRPRTMFTEGLFLIEDEDLEKIRKIGWQKYIKKSVNQEQLENISLIYYKGNVQQIKNKFLGSLYELDFKKLWEENYRDLSFGQFKHNFYSNTLVDSKYHPLNIENIFKPKIMIDLAAKENFNFDDIGKKLNEYLLGFEKALNYFKTNDKHFDLKDFSEKMIDLFPLYRNKFKQMELIVSSLINIFNNTLQPVQAQFAQNNFLQFNNNTNKYSVKNTYYKSRISLIKRNVFSNFNNSRDREKRFIISAKPAGQKSKNNVDYKVIIAQICELFDLVSYKIKAGDNAQFFMRVNSERSLQAIARGEINSKTIELVKDRHENSIKWMKYFFTKLKTNEERWDKIQSYFLGHDLEE